MPGLKEIKKVSLHGILLHGDRYRPLIQQGDSDYDDNTTTTGSDSSNNNAKLNNMHEFSLQRVLKDFMGSDPSIRYQVAKNAFQRALFDARVSSR